MVEPEHSGMPSAISPYGVAEYAPFFTLHLYWYTPFTPMPLLVWFAERRAESAATFRHCPGLLLLLC